MSKTGFVLLSLLLGCSDSSSSSAVDAPPSPTVDGAVSGADARPNAADAPPAGAADAPSGGTADAPSAADAPTATTFTLTIDNALGWCSVTVNGGTAFTDATKSFNLAASSKAQLHGDTSNATFFVWGFWSGTDNGDHDTNKSTTVTMSGNKTVGVCCPDVGQTACP